MAPRALIFDVDGTLAETEEIHRAAFNTAFAAAGLAWHWDVACYARLLATTGGRERILRHAAETGAAGIDAASLHAAKTAIYNAMLRRGAIALRPGIEPLMRLARAHGLALAIATTTSRANVETLIAATLGPGALGWFASVRAGEDVARKKPDPEVYRLVLADLRLSGADCIALEDTANGLAAAAGAGIPVLITPSLYSQGEDFSGAARVVDDLGALVGEALVGEDPFRLMMMHCAAA